MKYFILFSILLIRQQLYSQTFLDSYKKHQESKIKADKQLDSLRKTEQNDWLKLTKRKIKKIKKERLVYINQQIIQFDTVFQSYKRKTGFNFNTADSLLIIYQTGVESNLRSFFIVSGKDTITYREKWEMAGLHDFRRKIVNEPFFDTTERQTGYKIIDVRDLLFIIANNRTCSTAQTLAKESQVFDGETSTIIYGKKKNSSFLIEECLLPAFSFVPIWRKEE